jgi:hypothetical protein
MSKLGIGLNTHQKNRLRHPSTCYPWRKNNKFSQSLDKERKTGGLKVFPIHIELKNKGETVRRKEYHFHRGKAGTHYRGTT